MFKLGIRAKTILLTIVPTLTVAILLGSYFINVRLDDIKQNMKYEGANIVHQLGPLAEFSVMRDSISLMHKVTSMSIEDHQGVRSASIYSTDGKLLSNAGMKPSIANSVIKNLNSHVTDKLIIQQTSRSLVIISTITNQAAFHKLGKSITTPTSHKVAGYFVVELDKRHAADLEYQAYMATLFIALIGLAISILIGLRLGRDITRPIRAIAKAVKAIKDGDLHTRVDINASKEIQTLKEGVNAMAHSLNNSHEEMQHTVDQATADLKTALARLEGQNDELTQARRVAINATRVKSDFLANMSHEIRTPMNAIVGYTDLLQQTKLQVTQRDYLDTIAKSTQGLMRIINDILDFSKIEANKLELHEEPANLRAEVEDTLTLLAPLAHQKNIELALLIYDDVPANLMVDKLRFSQVITNLVNNAIKFTDHGSVITRVSLEHEDTHKTEIRVEVTDTGCGLTDAQQKRLFKAFSQADTSTTRDFGGTGLGLVICQRLIDKMDGEISIESEPGLGSTFAFTLLLKNCNNNDTPIEQPLKGKRIGIAGRLAPARMSLMQSCEQLGAEVIASSDPESLDTTDCDLLILNDNAVADTHLPYIILTNGDVQSAEEHYPNAIRVIAKPVARSRLINALCDFWQLETPSALKNHLSIVPDQPMQQIHVLAVDDNEINLKLLDTLLSKMGVYVTCADSGEAAIEAVKDHAFDLILMDIQMPKMDGIEATQRIQQLLDTPPPIVALTADVLGGQREHLLKNGFDDFQTKPVQAKQLHALIQHWTHQDLEEPEAQAEKSSEQYIDKKLGVERAGGNEAVAKEMLTMLLERLETDKNEMEHAHRAGDWEQVCKLVHKLHGATMYVGTPKLQQACFALEKAIKSEETGQYQLLFDQLMEVIEKTLSH